MGGEQAEPAPEHLLSCWLRHDGWAVSCCRRPEMCRGPWPSLDMRLTEGGYFLRRGVLESLLPLLGAEAVGWLAIPTSFLGAGLCFPSLAGGPSRTCTTLMTPTVTRSPQSRAGASRGESCLRAQRRA